MSLTGIVTTTVAWFAVPFHGLLAILGIAGTALLGALGARTDNMIFGAAEPKKKIKIQRTHAEWSALYEVVNLSTRDIVITAHGIEYFDGVEDKVWPNLNHRLIPEEHVPLQIPNRGDQLNMHMKLNLGYVYRIYVKDRGGKKYSFYPHGRITSHLKHWGYKLTGKKIPEPTEDALSKIDW